MKIHLGLRFCFALNIQLPAVYDYVLIQGKGNHALLT